MILSPSTGSLDKVEKSRLYYNHGVKEYWIVDPDSKVIEVLTPGEKYWNIYGAYGMDDIVTSPLLAGLEIQLKDIFKYWYGRVMFILHLSAVFSIACSSRLRRLSRSTGIISMGTWE